MICRVSGIVTAGDGSSYAPLYWGGLEDCGRVFEAIAAGCGDRGEYFSLVIDTGPGTVARRRLWADCRRLEEVV